MSANTPSPPCAGNTATASPCAVLMHQELPLAKNPSPPLRGLVLRGGELVGGPPPGNRVSPQSQAAIYAHPTKKGTQPPAMPRKRPCYQEQPAMRLDRARLVAFAAALAPGAGRGGGRLRGAALGTLRNTKRALHCTRTLVVLRMHGGQRVLAARWISSPIKWNLLASDASPAIVHALQNLGRVGLSSAGWFQKTNPCVGAPGSARQSSREAWAMRCVICPRCVSMGAIREQGASLRLRAW